jgi:iron complex transport system ATP-binding protein
VVTEELLADVFGLEARVIADPVAGTPLVVPVSSRANDPR